MRPNPPSKALFILSSILELGGNPMSSSTTYTMPAKFTFTAVSPIKIFLMYLEISFNPTYFITSILCVTSSAHAMRFHHVWHVFQFGQHFAELGNILHFDDQS